MGVETITLTDSTSGATASVLAGLGFNCFALNLVYDGQPIPVIWSEAGFETGLHRASGSGNPIQFPYPGRIQGQTLNWQGREYPLEGDDSRGNALHGFVLTRPWRVIERAADRVVGQFQAAVDDPQLLDRWPADFRITATYELSEGELRTVYRVDNPDQRPLPCGLGLHPYFCVPLGGKAANDCRVQLPVTKRWELVDMLPTGTTLPVENAERFWAGLPFEDMAFDDVFAGLEFDEDLCTCRIVDPHSGLRLQVQFDRAFRECVVYNPPHREAVCIEPYTCVPNASELQAAGVDSGWRVLQPGESFEGRMVVRLE